MNLFYGTVFDVRPVAGSGTWTSATLQHHNCATLRATIPKENDEAKPCVHARVDLKQFKTFYVAGVDKRLCTSLNTKSVHQIVIAFVISRFSRF